MKIETKFNVGQKIWFMDDNKPRCEVVGAIRVIQTKGTVSICYAYLLPSPRLESNLSPWIDESKLFPEKDHLLKSL